MELEYMNYPKFTPEMKKTHKILIPNMAPVQFRILAAVMEQARGPAHGFAHERGRKAIPGCVRAHRVRIGGAGICHMPASCQSCRQSCSLLLCQFILACRAHP